jgi:hypothetical protein
VVARFSLPQGGNNQKVVFFFFPIRFKSPLLKRRNLLRKKKIGLGT